MWVLNLLNSERRKILSSDSNSLSFVFSRLAPERKMEGEIIYVAVGEDSEDRKSTLKWALKRAKQEKSPSICVFYVLVPAQMITLPNGLESPAHAFTEDEVTSFREREKQEVFNILRDCGTMCDKYKVLCQTIQIPSESITEGILELIDCLKIQKLVMGASPNGTCSRRMSTPTSRKANYVLHYAPNFCRIWFVCNNHLIYTRKGQATQLTGNPERNQLNRSDRSEFSIDPLLTLEAGGPSSWSPNDSMHHGASPMRTMPPNIIDTLYTRLQQVNKESKVATEKMYRELREKLEAQKEASDATLRVEVAEKRLVELEEDLRYTKTKLTNALDDLFNASVQLTSYENQADILQLKVKEMGTKLESSQNWQQLYKKLSNRLQKKLDDAIHIDNGSVNHIGEEQPVLDVPIFSCDYSVADLEEATNCFDASLKIGEGDYGDVYRGFLDHTYVAIKILGPKSVQGPAEFKCEVDVLSKLRHPNLVTLIGTCTNSWGLIYEYLPNGSLQDRIICKDNTPPLPWERRIQIATELCSVLIFLHSRKPNSVIHADINPTNVLLDANFICKLSGFGSSVSRHVSPKTDVYAFGIILMCLLTGESSSDIVEKVQQALENDSLSNLLDYSAGQWPFVRAMQLAHLAVRCCHGSPEHRPDLASEVWMILNPTNDPSRNLPIPPLIISEDRIPAYFTCPILQEIMHDPNFAADGFTYEASAIQAWFEGGHETSPMTNLRLPDLELIPNRALRSTIEEWRQNHKCA